MTNRERMLAAFRGDEVDRFPVWLKMDNATWRNSQPDDVKRMSTEQLLAAASCDLLTGNDSRAMLRQEQPHVRVRQERFNGTRRTTYETPDGPLVGEEGYDETTQSWHPVRYPAESADDLPKIRWLYRDTSYSAEAGARQAARAKQSDWEAKDAVTMAHVGPGPLMNLVEHVCGPVAIAYHLADVPELVEEILALMHADRLRQLTALLSITTADTLWLTENTSTTLISPGMFREYCMPHLRDYGQLILEHGIIPVHHMCGTLHALLEMIDALPAMVNEAYTTRPLGDVSLAEGRTRMPSKALMGGTNATLWMQPAERIVEEVAADLADCPDRRRVFLTSAGVLPPIVSLAKARRVTDALKRL